MSFHVRQRVVRIGDSNLAGAARLGASVPRKGDVVTIRAIYVGVCGRTILLLEEHHNEHLRHMSAGDVEPGFPSDGFRPLKETSIECLRAHLAPIKQREEA